MPQPEVAGAACLTPREAWLWLHPGRDRFAAPPPAARCCSNQSSLICCQALGNGGEVCWDPGEAPATWGEGLLSPQRCQTRAGGHGPGDGAARASQPGRQKTLHSHRGLPTQGALTPNRGPTSALDRLRTHSLTVQRREGKGEKRKSRRERREAE